MSKPDSSFSPRRRLLLGAAAASAAAGFTLPAWAASNWKPTKPVTILVGFAPGGSADQIARQLSFAVEGILPQPVVVMNRAGAAGTIAAQATADAEPDGYTLFVGGGSETTSVGHFNKLNYDPRTSFTPVIKVSRAPSILAVRADAPYPDMKAFITEAKKQAEGVSYGSTGEGGIFHATGLVFEKEAGIKLLHVPYKGAAAAMNALVAGDIDSAFGAYEEMKGLIDGGRIRPLAIFSGSRLPALPNVPTMTELGVPVAIDNMKGLMGPAGMPDDVVATLHDAFYKAMQTPGWKEWVAKSGLTEDYKTGKEFQQDIVSAYDTIGKAVGQ